MTTYEFSFATEGFDVDDDEHVERLYACCDGLVAMPSSDGSRTLVTFVVQAADEVTALRTAAEPFASIRQARVVGIDRDLVMATDIAFRIGRTPEAVRQFADGTRRSGDFPTHVGVVGKGIRIWYWADVDPWLRSEGLLDDTTPRPISVSTARNFEDELSVRSLESVALFWNRASRPATALSHLSRSVAAYDQQAWSQGVAGGFAASHRTHGETWAKSLSGPSGWRIVVPSSPEIEPAKPFRPRRTEHG